MRLRVRALAAPLALFALFGASYAHAEYAVLRSGQRMHITGYQRLGSTVRLQIGRGSVDVDAAELVAIEPEEVFAAARQPASTPALDVPFADLIQASSQKHGVDRELIASVIAAESNFNPQAISRKQARGLMQLLPKTARKLKVANMFDPAQNIDGGTRYLKELLELYNQDIVLALAAYNAGPERVQQFGGVPPYPETVSYVRRVTRELNKHKGTTNDAANSPLQPARNSSPEHLAAGSR